MHDNLNVFDEAVQKSISKIIDCPVSSFTGKTKCEEKLDSINKVINKPRIHVYMTDKEIVYNKKRMEEELNEK